MKALHIIQRYPPAIGGSENWCSSICRFLSEKGIITKVATINLYNIEEFFKKLPIEQEFVKLGKYDYDKGVHITRYKLWSFAYAGLDVRLVNFLLYAVKLYRTEFGSIFKHSPHSFDMYFRVADEIRNSDIVHLHTLPYFHNIIGFAIAKIYGKKIAITPHFHPGHIHYEKKIFYKLMNNCDAVIVMTEFEKKYLTGKGVSSNKIRVTGNSINNDYLSTDEEFDVFRKNLFKEHALSGDSKKIIFIGRKEPHKGLWTLIEAVKELAGETNIDIAFFIVGPELTEFTNARKNLDNINKLRIIDFGPVSDRDKENLLRVSDVLALPSEFEAFGIVFLEAWKYKKPVIGSDRGAIPEVIKGAGLCAKYADTQDLKEKIKTLLFDTELAEKLGIAGREKLEKEFSLENIGNKVLNIYHNLRSGKKRLLVVSNLFPPYSKGGSEIAAYQQAIALKKMGYDIRIFAGKRDSSSDRFRITKEKKEFKITRVNLHDIDFDRRSINLDKPKVQNEFRKLLCEFTPDMVHFHNIYSLSLKITEECVRMRVPSVITLHDHWFICFKNTLLTDSQSICDDKVTGCRYCKEEFFDAGSEPGALQRRNEIFMRYLNRIDWVISPSAYLMKRFVERGLRPERTSVINNGIDIKRFKYAKKNSADKVRFGYIGQIIEHKGIENLIRGLSLLKEAERNKMSLLIVGSGEKLFYDYCRRLVGDLSLNNCVKFYGSVENSQIPKILSSIDILAVPSIWPENSPVTIMEALASGTPVLSSDVGGISELIQDGFNGYLHRHDEPASLAKNMSRIIANPHIIKEMRLACLKKAKEYALESQVKIIARHYDELMNHKISG